MRGYFKPIRDLDDLYILVTDRNLILHSHAWQLLCYAIGIYDLWVNNIITIGSPIRDDTWKIIAPKIGNIKGRWLHLWSPTDRMQVLGGLFDGHVGIRRTPPAIPGVLELRQMPGGHSTVLNKPAEMAWFRDVAIEFFTRPASRSRSRR